MVEKKLLADEELEQVNGGVSGRYAKDEYCQKWYHDLSHPDRYVYLKEANSDIYYATIYTLDDVGNVNVRDNDFFRGRGFDALYSEVSIAELPEAIRKAAGC